MNKLTAEKCKEQFEEWFKGVEIELRKRGLGFAAVSGVWADMRKAWHASREALEIALPILEQQGETDITKVLDKARGMETYWKIQCRGITDHCENLQEKITKLTYENAGLKGSVENAAGCISAAYFEGLADALEESSDERLVDLVKRRLLLSYLPVETPTTNDALVVMGDVVLLDQLEDSRKTIVTQSSIIDLQDKRIFELEQQERGEGWIEWGGGKCPVPASTPIEVKFRNGVTNRKDTADGWSWEYAPDYPRLGDIIAYRIIPEQPTNQNGE